MMTPSSTPATGLAFDEDAAVHAGDVLRLHALIVHAGGPASNLDHRSTQRLTAALHVLVNAPAEHDDAVQELLLPLVDAGAHMFERLHPTEYRPVPSPFEDALRRADDRRARTLIDAQRASARGLPSWALCALVDHPQPPEPARPAGSPPLFELALQHQWDNAIGTGADQIRLWNAVLLRRSMPPETPDQLPAVQVSLLRAMGRHRVALDSDLKVKLLKTLIDLPAIPGERKPQRAARQVVLLDTLVHDLRWHLPEHQATALLGRVCSHRGSMELARRLIGMGANPAGLEGALALLEAQELRRALRTTEPGAAATPAAAPATPRRRL